MWNLKTCQKTFQIIILKELLSCIFNESLNICCCLVAQSCPTLRPHRLQHARLPSLSPTPVACSNSHPFSQWCHPTILSSVLQNSPPEFNLSQHQVFSNESAFHIRWPKYWSFSFSISPSSEYSRFISFRIDL